MSFRFLDPAEEEMTEAARIYEDQAVGLGERFLDEVEGVWICCSIDLTSGGASGNFVDSRSASSLSR